METQNPALLSPVSLYQQVAQAWKRRDYQQAIEILTCASQQQPSDAKLLLNLGEAHGLRYDYAQAQRCLEQAVSVSTNRVATLTEAGREQLETETETWEQFALSMRRVLRTT